MSFAGMILSLVCLFANCVDLIDMNVRLTFSVYIIMEYAQCGSLLDVIRRHTFIDEFRSRRWFRQLLEAVAYCHERGVVHR